MIFLHILTDKGCNFSSKMSSDLSESLKTNIHGYKPRHVGFKNQTMED